MSSLNIDINLEINWHAYSRFQERFPDLVPEQNQQEKISEMLTELYRKQKNIQICSDGEVLFKAAWLYHRIVVLVIKPGRNGVKTITSVLTAKMLERTKSKLIYSLII